MNKYIDTKGEFHMQYLSQAQITKCRQKLSMQQRTINNNKLIWKLTQLPYLNKESQADTNVAQVQKNVTFIT